MTNALRLLNAAERALQQGRTERAFAIFEEITTEYGGTMESLAALAYLRDSARKGPRRVAE
jgi:hypothetical protein